jgi:cytochrome c
MRPSRLALALVMVGVVAPHPLRADVAKGRQLAQQWCANCHIVGTNPSGTVQPGPPSFPLIARDRSVDQLHAFLTHPHGAMPDLSLTRAEIDDLIAYIETLR